MGYTPAASYVNAVADTLKLAGFSWYPLDAEPMRALLFLEKTQARHSKTIRRSLLSEFDFLPASFRHLDTSFQVTNEWYVQGRQVIKHLLKSHTLSQCGNIESCTNSLVILLSVTVPTSILCPVVCLPFHMQTYLSGFLMWTTFYECGSPFVPSLPLGGLEQPWPACPKQASTMFKKCWCHTTQLLHGIQ